jgi:O-antigen/teichoic acid export membrane protein
LSRLSHFLKGSILLSLANVLVRLSGILVLVPLARILGSEQLGIYSLMFWVVQNGLMIGRLGVDAAMHRNGAQVYQADPQAAGRLLGVGAVLMSVSFSILAIAVWVWRSPIADRWLGDIHAAKWFGYTAFTLLTEGLGLVLITGLLSLHQFKPHSYITTIGAFVRLLFSPLLAWQYGLSGALLGLALASLLQLIAALYSFWKALQQYQIRLSYQGFLSQSQDILKFGLPFYAGNALIGLMTLPMMGEVGRIAGVEALGQLRIGQSLSQLVGFLPGAVSPVAISVLSEAHGSEQKEFHKIRSVHLRSNWLLALTLTMLLSLASRPLIFVLFGQSYLVAVPAVIGMSWVAFVTVLAENLNLYTLSAGQTKAIAVGSVVQKIIVIGVAFWLIPTQGVLGFVAGLLSGVIVQALIMTVYLWREIEVQLKQTYQVLGWWTIVCSLVMWGICQVPVPLWLTPSIATALSIVVVHTSIHLALKVGEKKQLIHLVENFLMRSQGK